MTETVSSRFIEETEFWKTTSVAQTGILAIIAGWFARVSFRFLRNKNNKLDQLDRRLLLVETKLERIDKCLHYKDEDGSISPLNEKMRQINHRLSGIDLGAAQGFDELQESIKEVKILINKKDRGNNDKQ